jgi:hypothetical protein
MSRPAPCHFGWWQKDDDGRSESHKIALGHPLEEPLKNYPSYPGQ